MNKNSQYVIPFESYKTLLEIQGLADGINKNAEEIYEYDTEALAKELLLVLREIKQDQKSRRRDRKTASAFKRKRRKTYGRIWPS